MIWSQGPDKTPLTRFSWGFVAVLWSISVLIAVRHYPLSLWPTLATMVWAWSESLASMILVLQGAYTHLSRKLWTIAIGGQAVAMLSLWSSSPLMAQLSLGMFNMTAILTLPHWGRRRGGAIAASLLGALSPYAGLVIGHHHIDFAEMLLLLAIPGLWAQSYIHEMYFLWHSQYCQKIQTTFPREEERLKTRMLIWSVLTALGGLFPYYVDPLKPDYLLESLLLGIVFLTSNGLSLITPLPRRMMRLKWLEYINQAYLLGIVALFINQIG
ncbi:hypothetical protein [Sulfobacillus thermosulfidooxidans]|uniref:hypothetical protein n=1 Tax=Sulfobacillus thermosulfidooxidans TaxID=28034 RepID=UPI001111F811|nr:hypothetical protein [Sulfobacillus thermosulfidooxidans]